MDPYQNTAPTRWQFYTDANTAWDAMLEACEHASKTIDLEQFIFLNDEVGDKFIKKLAKKAAEGVKVRVICDAAGSFSFWSASLLSSLTTHKIEIVFFNSLIPGGLGNHTLWFFRDHRKLMVVDSEIGFTGSMCLTSEVRTWRDVHVRIEGEVVSEMQEAFESMWARAHKRRRTRVEVRAGLEGFKYVTNSPIPGRRFLYYRLIDAVRGAQKNIYLSTPYFVPDRRFFRVLRLAAKRGVDVRLIVPENSDHSIVDMGARTFFESALKAGIKIFLYKDRVLHSKYAVVDDEWCTLGSMNFDNVSFLYNFEANLVSTHKAFVAETTALFFTDLGGTRPLLHEEWAARPFLSRLVEKLVIPIRKFL